MDDYVKKAYSNVEIEINGQSDLNDLNDILKEGGQTNIKIKIKRTSKIYVFSLKNPRKFDFSTFNHIKSKEYVKKISF